LEKDGLTVRGRGGRLSFFFLKGKEGGEEGEKRTGLSFSKTIIRKQDVIRKKGEKGGKEKGKKKKAIRPAGHNGQGARTNRRMGQKKKKERERGKGRKKGESSLNNPCACSLCFRRPFFREHRKEKKWGRRRKEEKA